MLRCLLNKQTNKHWNRVFNVDNVRFNIYEEVKLFERYYQVDWSNHKESNLQSNKYGIFLDIEKCISIDVIRDLFCLCTAPYSINTTFYTTKIFQMMFCQSHFANNIFPLLNQHILGVVKRGPCTCIAKRFFGTLPYIDRVPYFH